MNWLNCATILSKLICFTVYDCYLNTRVFVLYIDITLTRSAVTVHHAECSARSRKKNKFTVYFSNGYKIRRYSLRRLHFPVLNTIEIHNLSVQT
jgi:hypothetical protein